MVKEAAAKAMPKTTVVDKEGKPKVVYHGTGRADRVGTVFSPERATSGPMAFFTDNKEIAESYATCGLYYNNSFTKTNVELKYFRKQSNKIRKDSEALQRYSCYSCFTPILRKSQN